MRTMKEILEEAHALSAEERRGIAESLLQSLRPVEPGIEAAWIREAERRLEAFQAGGQDAIPGELVFQEAAHRLRAW